MRGAAEIAAVFFRLGLTSFGGPVAHLGYFRRDLVERRGWLSEADFSAIVGLCQFLPGPASSQTGFCIGLRRGGWLGGVAAWVGFTLPSAVLMILVARGAGWVGHSQIGRGVLHGLQLAAVAVVAQAVWTMARGLCPEFYTRALAVMAFMIMLVFPGSFGQVAVLIMGAVTGCALLTAPVLPPAPVIALSRRVGMVCLAVFAALLVVALVARTGGNFGLFEAFYRAGALVFGGGHVVLPLLHDAVVQPGWVSPNIFLAGYGAAQAMPGPLFTVAAYLGAVSLIGSGGVVGAVIALVAIFLPGLLLVAGILPFWHELQRRPGVAAAVMGLNAAVVGLLGYALVGLVTGGNVHGVFDVTVMILAVLALMILKFPPIAVVAACAAAAAIF